MISPTTTSAPSVGSSAPARVGPRPRLRGLDGLRFLAALLVLGYHYTGIGMPHWGAAPADVFPGLNQVTRYGFLGVQLFFMISGFVILMTAYGRPVTTFAASRVARLFPAYWAAVVLTVMLHLVWHDGRDASAVDSLLNLTMIQNAWDATDVQGPFWTLWFEMLFYLIVGAFILVGITRRRVIALAVLWPLVAQLARANDADLLSTVLIPSYAPYFAVGMLLFLVYRDGGDLAVWLAIALTSVLCVRQAYHYAGRASELVGAPVSAVVCAAAVIAMVGLIWALSAGPLRHVDWRVLSTLGALTYPLYLVHGQFGFAVIDVLHDDASRWVVLGIATALSLALAAVLHHLVENRVHDRLRQGVRSGLEKTFDTARR
ncbi:acyltransferase family protein [Isoptericola sp. NPDC056134]|uniref:acyltransferase family protein n=1 Tax=Isoptericola sp. NPDC056134 TaxID=3345723 RepID=UPI0035E5784B